MHRWVVDHSGVLCGATLDDSSAAATNAFTGADAPPPAFAPWLGGARHTNASV
jgi:hypothetical protein